MDSIKKQIDLGNITVSGDTIDLSGPSSGVYTSSHMGSILSGSPGYSYTYPDTITLSNTITLSDTINTSILPNTMWTNSAMTTGTAGQLSLNGADADIVINGVSLMSKIEAIAERLNLLDVNRELEEEWDQLRELGERYRELEQELKEKSTMWKTLKTKTSNKPRS